LPGTGFKLVEYLSRANGNNQSLAEHHDDNGDSIAKDHARATGNYPMIPLTVTVGGGDSESDLDRNIF
jgi:hypothetical protein